jgi:hypothetical protein
VRHSVVIHFLNQLPCTICGFDSFVEITTGCNGRRQAVGPGIDIRKMGFPTGISAAMWRGCRDLNDKAAPYTGSFNHIVNSQDSDSSVELAICSGYGKG